MEDAAKIETPVPMLKVAWDNDAKDVSLQFETREFPTWHFVIAVLEMAKRKAEDQLNATMAMQRVQHMQAMVQEQQLRGRIIAPR